MELERERVQENVELEQDEENEENLESEENLTEPLKFDYESEEETTDENDDEEESEVQVVEVKEVVAPEETTLVKEYVKCNNRNILNKIEHTLLRPDVVENDIRNLIEEAENFGFGLICVQTSQIKRAKKYIAKESALKISTVIGFPFGEETTKEKVFSTKRARKLGANEIDMVISISRIKEGKWKYVKNEILKVVKTAKKLPVKVILETALLTKEEIVKASKIAMEAGARYIKTSTGYSKEGATAENVALIKNTVKNGCKIKASGGIRKLEDLLTMVNCGADRIGTSSGVAIYNELINFEDNIVQSSKN